MGEDLLNSLDEEWYARHFLTDTDDIALRTKEEERLLRALCASDLATKDILPWARRHFKTPVVEGLIDVVDAM